MAHKAERIRKRAIKDMERAQKAAEEYSLAVNGHWNSILCRVFGVEGSWYLETIDLEYLYDELTRRVERSL